MRLKHKKEYKTSKILFRCTEKQRHEIKAKALLYCDGNISEYALYAVLDFIPGKSDFEIEAPKNKRPRKTIN